MRQEAVLAIGPQRAVERVAPLLRAGLDHRLPAAFQAAFEQRRQGAFERLYGPSTGAANLSRFRLPAFDAVYNRMSALPNGPERDALFREAKRLSAVYAPYKQHVHRFYNDMAHPWLLGFRRALFGNRWWHMVDIDPARKPAG